MSHNADMRNGLLGTLPTELQISVFAYLDYPSFLFLSSTNTYFRRNVRPSELVPDYDKHIFVQSAQQYPRHAEARAYGCFRCYRVLHRDAFAEKQTTGARNKGNSKEYYRFCLECGEKNGVYTRGSQVRKTDGVLYWKCHGCPALKSGFYCTDCTKCHDCLRLSPDFDEKRCPRCGENRIEGEKRQLNRGGAFGMYGSNFAMVTSVGLQMAEWESEFGESASPEWFEDDWWN